MNYKIFNTKMVNNKNKKYALKRIGSTLLVVASTISVLTGCIGKDKIQNNASSNQEHGYYQNMDTTTNPIDDHISYYPNNNVDSLDLTDISINIINSNLTIDSNSVKKFVNYINSIEVNYPHSELYGIDQSLNKYYSTSNYKSSAKNIFVNKKISAEKLYSIVIANNEKENLKQDEIISNSTLLKMCQIISNVINSSTNDMNDSELKNLSEKILDLKIQKFTEFSNGYYDPVEGRMGFAIDYISSKSDDFFKKVIEHETFHLIQSNTIQELNYIPDLKTRFGPSSIYNDVPVNSLYWNWYFEGSAEYLMLNYNNTNESITYQNNIKHFDTIKVATILNSANDVNLFENLSLDNNLDSVFEYFGCNTQEQKKEIVKLMFCSDIILQVNHSDALKQFYELYEKTYGKKMSITDKREYEKQLKGSVATTLTKIFYTNLANKVANEQLSIKEIFSYISIFESELNRFCWYNTTSYYEVLSDFYQDYTEIQSNFFEIISRKINANLEDVQQAYNSFNQNYNVDANELTLLSNDKKEFYRNIIETRKSYKTKTINYVYDNYINVKKEK